MKIECWNCSVSFNIADQEVKNIKEWKCKCGAKNDVET